MSTNIWSSTSLGMENTLKLLLPSHPQWLVDRFSGPPIGTSDWQAGFPVALQGELVSAVRDYRHLVSRAFQVCNTQPRSTDYGTILIFLCTVTEGNFKKRQSFHFMRSINIILDIFVFLILMRVLEWSIFLKFLLWLNSQNKIYHFNYFFPF